MTLSIGPAIENSVTTETPARTKKREPNYLSPLFLSREQTRKIADDAALHRALFPLVAVVGRDFVCRGTEVVGPGGSSGNEPY
jgi:hypothetical protein